MIQDIAQSEADIVHLHWPNPMAVLAYLVARPKGRLVVTYHSDIVRQHLLGRAFSPFLYSALDRCDAILATSPNYVASSSILRSYTDRCRVIPYGINFKRFERRDSDAERSIRAAHGSRILISVGRLVYYKGFEYLIRAMAKVNGELIIIGDGPLRGFLENEAQAIGVRSRVHFLGEVQNTQLSAYYHASDVFVLPSVARSEAFGIVQLEAMACGKPVVNTQLDSGVPYVSLDGETGFTVEPRDSNALAVAISTLLDEHALRARFGAAARRRVEKEFNAELMARRTLDVYQEVMEGTTSALGRAASR